MVSPWSPSPVIPARGSGLGVDTIHTMAALSEGLHVPRASQDYLISPKYKQPLIYGDTVVAPGIELEIKANRHHLP